MVNFDVEPRNFPKGPKGNGRLHLDRMILHRWYRAWFQDKTAKPKVSKETCINYEVKLIQEIQRRGLKWHRYNNELERLALKLMAREKKIELPEWGLYLMEPHARLIWEKKKTLIIKGVAFKTHIEEPILLAEDSKAYCIINLSPPEKITLQEFHDLKPRHQITEDEYADWSDKYAGWKNNLHAYEFRIVRKFSTPFEISIPRGVQNFFRVRAHMVSRKAESVRIKFLGTLCSTPFPRNSRGSELKEDQEKCDCPQCKDRASLDRIHSSILLDGKVMIDIGELQVENFKKFYDKLDAVIFTHAHPDHMGMDLSKLPKGYDKPVFVTRQALDDFKENSRHELGEWFENIEIIQSRKSFSVAGHRFEFVPVEHSVKARTFAIKIDGSVFYAPDFLKLSSSKDLSGISLYIGDGSSFKRNIVHVKDGEEVGHMGMTKQLDMCAENKIRVAIFTHIGHVRKTHETLKKDLKAYVQEKGYEIEVDVAKEGDIFDFASKKLSKVLAKEARFFTPNKPGWRIFEPQELFEIKQMKPPFQIQEKIDGARIEIVKSGDTIEFWTGRGRKLKNCFIRLADELKALKGDFVFDAEARIFREGKPTHRGQIIGYVNPDKHKPEIEKEVIFEIFDVLYSGKDIRSWTLKDRLSLLAKINFKPLDHFRRMDPGLISSSRKAVLNAINSVRNRAGSEGAMIKCLESSYTKRQDNLQWVKIKNLKEVDAMVVRCEEQKAPKRGIYNYYTCAGPYSKKCAGIVERLQPKKIAIVHGKPYAYLGGTFNGKWRLNKGDIIRIHALEVNKKPVLDEQGNETGCFVYSLFHPSPIEPVPERSVPDTLGVLDRLSTLLLPTKKVGKPRDEEYEELAKPGLPLPPSWYGYQPKQKKTVFVIQKHWPAPKGAEKLFSTKILGEHPHTPLSESSNKITKSREHRIISAPPGHSMDFRFYERLLKFREHLDFRLEHDTDCYGITPHPPSPVWEVFLDRMRKHVKTMCAIKPDPPKGWLHAGEGKTEYLPKGEPGASEERGGLIRIVDKGTVKYGCQRRNFHEYFFSGSKYLNGRWILRFLKFQDRLAWLLWKPKDQLPAKPWEHDDGEPDMIPADRLSARDVETRSYKGL